MDSIIRPDSTDDPRRFVILWHALPPSAEPPTANQRISHFDLMLENKEHLVTFELPRLPIPSERIPLVRLPNHRTFYLEFEGPLDPGPNGEDRGHVTRWAAGSYQFMKQTVAGSKLVVELTSTRFSGQIVLKPKSRPKYEDPHSQPLSRRNGRGEEDLRFLSVIERGDEEAFWTEAVHWEMYVSRWALKDRTCSKT